LPLLKNNTAQEKTKRKIAGFSIDDILSHKTAALKEKEAANLSIVRPWDISAASATSSAHSGNGGHGGNNERHHGQSANRSKSKNNQPQSDSPLDALFQMASKTFEGLKAKSGRHKYNQMTRKKCAHN